MLSDLVCDIRLELRQSDRSKSCVVMNGCVSGLEMISESQRASQTHFQT